MIPQERIGGRMALVILHNTIKAWDIIDANHVHCEGCDMEYIILCRGEYDRISGTTAISKYLAA